MVFWVREGERSGYEKRRRRSQIARWRRVKDVVVGCEVGGVEVMVRGQWGDEGVREERKGNKRHEGRSGKCRAREGIIGMRRGGRYQ
jgi:hypothetical protein